MKFLYFRFIDAKRNLFIFWTKDSIFLIIILKNKLKEYKNDSGIRFLLNSSFENTRNMKIIFVIKNDHILTYSNKNIKGSVGWLNVPFYNLDEHFVHEANYLKEKKSISFKIFTNQIIHLDYRFNTFKNRFFNLIILVEKEGEEIYTCKIVISRKKELIKHKKNIILSQIFNTQSGFFFKKVSVIKLIINQKHTCVNSPINFNFINKGIDFEQVFFVKKEPIFIQFSCHFFYDEPKLNEFCVKNEPFIISERYQKKLNLFSTGIYQGKEMRLKVDNAELILPENCLYIEESVISIQKVIKIKQNEMSLEFKNLIKCFPHHLKFKKPLKLYMKSPTKHPTTYDSSKELKQLENGMFEQELENFCHHGLISKWKSDETINFYYNFEWEIENNCLIVSLNLSTLPKENVCFFVNILFINLIYSFKFSRLT